MPFPVLGSNSAVAEFAIDNSLRFNDDDSAYLDKTFSSSGNRKTLTISCWIKRATLSTFQTIISAGANGATYSDDISFQSSDKLMVDLISTSGRYQAQSSALFRDVSAWYHVVVKIDTTQASNRMLVYVNNEQVAVNSTGIPQNEDITFGSNTLHNIGRRSVNNGSPADYYMSDFHFIDGQALAPTEFGETNDNGVWIPKGYEGTYGTNGFKLEFQDSGNLGDDTSGNTNDFTATNLTATDQTTDTPTNNFCTLNSLINSAQNGTLSEGNTKLVSGSSLWGHKLGTMGVTNGKWYYEAKVTSSTGNHYVGWQDIQPTQAQNAANPQSDSSGTTIWFTNTANDTTGFLRKNDTDDSAVSNGAIANNDIIGLALDLDSGTQTLTIYKNGTAIDSDNTIASGNTGTLVPFIANATSGASIEMNFGNPAFSISSGNSDANGYGNFEYAVPSGYYALCTKNLAEYG